MPTKDPEERFRGNSVTLHELEAFLRVALHSNFKKAAENLFVTQPALTRRIQSLEAKLNTRLFDRTTRRVQLTPSGRELHAIAERVTYEFSHSLSELSAFIGGHKGHVSIACLPSVACSLLPPVMVQFAQSHPDVAVTVKSVDAKSIEDLLKAGEIDFGISTAPPDLGQMEFRAKLMSDDFVLICSRTHPLARRKRVELEELQAFSHVWSGTRSSLTPVLDNALLSRNLTFKRQFEVGNLTAVGAVVETGLGIALIPTTSLRLMQACHIVAVPLGTRMQRHIGVLALKNRSLSIVGQRFLDAVLAQVKTPQDEDTSVSRARTSVARRTH